jgi:putative tricarboxylic transport membrane protein
VRRADLVTAAVLAGLAGVVVVDALQLGIGWGTDGPESGFFPFWLAVTLLGISGVLVVQAARRREARPFVRRDQLAPVLKVLGPLAAFVSLTGGIRVGELTVVPALGLYVSAALYLAVYMRWVGRHAWWAVALAAVAIPAAAFLVFETWFLVPMPKGPVEAWLGY